MPTLEVNGFRARYQRLGQGPDLVYVHGGFASLGRALQSRMPQDLRWQRDFSRRFRLLSYDRRGCGRSSCPPGGFDLPTQAADLAGLLDQLDIGSAHVFASSAGGPIAMRFAADHPRRVRSLVLAGTAPEILNPGDGVRERILAAYQELVADGAEAAFDRCPPDARICFTSAWDHREAEARGELADSLLAQRALEKRAERLPRSVRVRYYDAEVRNIHAYAGWSVHQDAIAVTAPALVLHGARDTVFPVSAGRKVADLLSKGNFQVVPEAGHTPVFTHDSARRCAIDFAVRAERRLRGGSALLAEPTEGTCHVV